MLPRVLIQTGIRLCFGLLRDFEGKLIIRNEQVFADRKVHFKECLFPMGATIFEVVELCPTQEN